ncbi:MAG: radical SAM protein [Candidatus Woesearchaeota archaeon]
MIGTFFTKIFQKTYYLIQRNPRSVGIHTTSKCNLSCDFCYSKNIPGDDVDWFSVLRQSKRMGVKNIIFLGGEPFCDPELISYLKYCSKNNMHPIIYTNAFLIDDEMIAFLAKLKQIELRIKFDSKENLESISGKGSYEILIDKIKKLSSFNISLHIFISKKNYNKIGEIISKVKKLNIPVSFERYMSSGSEIDKSYEISPEEYNQTLNQISHDKKHGNGFLLRSMIKGSECSCYVDAIYILSDGSAVPCPMSEKEQSVGNINSLSLKKIWDKYVDLRDEWMKIPKECLNCSYRYLCHGGCKTHTYRKFRKYDKTDPLCNRKKIPTRLVSKQKL